MFSFLSICWRIPPGLRVPSCTGADYYSLFLFHTFLWISAYSRRRSQQVDSILGDYSSILKRPFSNCPEEYVDPRLLRSDFQFPKETQSNVTRPKPGILSTSTRASVSEDERSLRCLPTVFFSTYLLSGNDLFHHMDKLYHRTQAISIHPFSFRTAIGCSLSAGS